MKTHIKMRSFVNALKAMRSAGFNKIVWAILLTTLFSTGAFAFSIGAANGLNCGLPNSGGVPITCPFATSHLDNIYETVHQNITRDALTQILSPSNQPIVAFRPDPTKYPDLSSLSVSFSMASFSQSNAFLGSPILDIETGNAETDYDQTNHAKHFDNEIIADSTLRLNDGFISITQKLSRSSLLSKTEVILLRKEFGGYIHTLQDFFSHTNWVNIHPGSTNIPSPALWKKITPNPTSDIKPCEIPPNLHFILNGPPYSGTLTDAGYTNLTSGYAFEPLSDALAPNDKCAHGLVGNGIHKDWSTRELHSEAREQAKYATQMFANAVINDTHNIPDNVCMFMTDYPCGAKLTTTVIGGGNVLYNPTPISQRSKCDSGTSPCTEFFNIANNTSGSSVTLTATPATGYKFTGWSGLDAGSCTAPASGGSTGTCAIPMDGKEKNITATFSNSDVPPPPILPGTWNMREWNGHPLPYTDPSSNVTIISDFLIINSDGSCAEGYVWSTDSHTNPFTPNCYAPYTYNPNSPFTQFVASGNPGFLPLILTWDGTQWVMNFSGMSGFSLVK
jgi:hypothetical protein